VQLSQLDDIPLFSLTMWKSEGGYCVGVQKFAGDQVLYETRRTVSAAVEAAVGALASPALPPLPY
jgi:hypothetical protein